MVVLSIAKLLFVENRYQVLMKAHCQFEGVVEMFAVPSVGLSLQTQKEWL